MPKKPYIFQRYEPYYQDLQDKHDGKPPSWDHPREIKHAPGNYQHNHIYYLPPDAPEGLSYWKPASKKDLETRKIHGAP